MSKYGCNCVNGIGENVTKTIIFQTICYGQMKWYLWGKVFLMFIIPMRWKIISETIFEEKISKRYTNTTLHKRWHIEWENFIVSSYLSRCRLARFVSLEVRVLLRCHDSISVLPNWMKWGLYYWLWFRKTNFRFVLSSTLNNWNYLPT